MFVCSMRLNLLFLFIFISCDIKLTKDEMIEDITELNSLIKTGFIGNEKFDFTNLTQDLGNIYSRDFCYALSKSKKARYNHINFYFEDKSCYSKSVSCNKSHASFVKGDKSDTLYLTSFKIDSIFDSIKQSYGNKNLVIILEK
jgi:hypothetical protein